MDRGARWATVHGVPELDTTEHTSLIAFAFDVISKTSLYLFIFEEMSTQVLCPFFTQLVFLLLALSSLHFGFQSLIRYMVCRYFLTLNPLSFSLLVVSFTVHKL